MGYLLSETGKYLSIGGKMGVSGASAPPGPYYPTSGLLVYKSFDDETTNLTINNTSNASPTLVITGTPSYIAGPGGKKALSGAVLRYFFGTIAPLNVFSAPFTISIWTKYTNYLFGGSIGLTRGVVFWDAGSTQLYGGISNVDQTKFSGMRRTTQIYGYHNGGWNHVSMTYQYNNMSLYLNGILYENSNTGSVTSGSTYLYLGGSASNLDYTSDVAEGFFYDRVLSDSEILQLYNM